MVRYGRAILLLALVAAACSSADDPAAVTTTATANVPESLLPESSAPAETQSPPTDAVVTAPAEEVIRLTPGETVFALSDPATAETGVWSVLANLGIGVYTGRGELVLGGSETSEEDFWLYDFEVPALIRMATSPSRPFAITHSRLSEVGFDWSIDDLLTFYQETYAGVPEAFLVQLFEAAGIGFEAGLQLTQLEEWLLLLDTVLPPNGSDAPQAAGPGHGDVAQSGATPAMARADRTFAAQVAGYQDFCGTISYGHVTSGWGHARMASPLVLTLIDLHFATHGLLLTSGVEATLAVEAPTAHEGHGADGAPVGFVAAVTLMYFPKPVVYVPACGPLINTDPAFLGPLQAVEINWEPDDVLEEHGWFREDGSAAFTDSRGEARLTYVPNEEDSGGVGLELDENGSLGATFNMRDALLPVVVNPRFLDLVPLRMPIEGRAELEIQWHQANVKVSVFETEGTSVMEYEAWTCDGETWQASFEWSGQPGGAEIEMFANFDFELPEGGKAINPVEATGGISVADVTLAMTIPYNFEFTLESGDPFAVVGINRQLGGGISSPAGGQVPFPATSFPEFDFVAPLEENLDCPD